MARQAKREWAAVIRGIWGAWTKRERRRATLRRKALRFEPLEGRSLLATDLATISGRVFKDVTGNGYNAGEEVAGAAVELFLDDGDSIFEPGAGDNLLANTTTNGLGNYAFNRLTAGTYFVRQPAQVVGAVSLNSTASSAITITPLEAQGVTGTNIDGFTTIGPSITASFPAGSTAQGSQVAAEALGGERDLFLELTAAANVLDDADFQAGGGVLNWNANTGARGRYVASWDGVDGNGGVLAQGLGGIDLTDAGLSQFLRMGVFGTDKPNGTAQVRVYSSAVDFSQSALTTIPQVPAAADEILFDYTAFTVGGGTGATLTNINAIELEIIANDNAMQGQVTFFAAVGPTVETQNFANFTPADLRIAKTVNNSTPNVGQNVTFTITVTNDGPFAASNVAVSDPLPAGLSFVSATPSQGSYVSATGVWTVGSVASAADATLQIVATVTTSGAKTNTAEVSASDQFDVDSTPGNNLAAEDDQASVVVTPAIADLSVTKTVDNNAPNVGQNVNYTVTVSNAGPATATNVAVSDVLPGTLTFVSSTPSQGAYVNGTGVWTVGSINSGANATLQITATVTVGGTTTNTAQVSAADQFDPDSTPANGVAAEDDQASIPLTTPRLLTKRLFLAE